MIVVTDAGPLNYLAGAGQLELLRRVYSRVVAPRVVFEEVTLAGAGRMGAQEVADAAWLEVEDEPPDLSLLGTLDPGESAAIPLAERLGATLLVDDGAAREVAIARGLVIIGTLGVLLLAKRNGHLPVIAPILSNMEGLGMFVSSDLRARVLRAAGEEP